MNRKIIEDIKIKKERVFHEPVPEIRTEIKTLEFKNNEIKKVEIEDKEIHKEISSKRLSRDPHLPLKKKTVNNYILILFFITLIIGIVFWGSFLFEKVNITITKKNQIFTLDQLNFTALKGLESSVPFEIMIVSDKKSEKIVLTNSAEVSLKAKGEIILYNEFSKTPEKLAINTYLSDENGKVYLTDKAVSIPGYTLKDNKIIPGQINVSVTSFLPGEAYNGSPTDFFINSYKGTTKYKKIYGKAKTEITGGALGLNYSLAENDKEQLKVIANSSLKNDLLKKVDSLIPKDYIFYPQASIFSYEINENILSPEAQAKIDITGTLFVVLLKEKNLEESIINKMIPKISNEELHSITVEKIDKLIFNFTDANQTITKELESVSFGLSGELNFVWTPNVEKLRNDLLGSRKEDLLMMFKKDIGIGEASVKIFPPWQKILPVDSSKIKIKII